MIEAKRINENEIIPSQRAGCLEYTEVPSVKGCGSLISPPEVMESVSIGPENLQTVHQSMKEKTDRKDKIESSMITLVKNHAGKLSKSETDKDRDSEVVLHSIESRDGPNSPIKESSCTECNIEPLNMIHFGDNNAKKISSVVCNEGSLENEEQLSREEPEAIVHDQTEKVDGGVDCCRVKEGTVIKEGKQLGLDEQNGCISSVEGGFRSSHEHLQSTEKDCVTDTDCSHQVLFDVQPSEKDGEDDDLPMRKQNGNATTVTNLEETLQIVPAVESVCSEVVGEENSERNICLMEKAGYQKAATSDENTCSLSETCTGISVESLPKTMDNAEPGGKVFNMTNLRFGLSIDQEAKSAEERKDDAKIQQVQFYHLSPHDEAEETSEKADPKMDEISQESNKSNKVIPFIGIDIPVVNILQPHDSPPQGKVKEIPFISESTYLDPTSQMSSETTDFFEVDVPVSELGKSHQTFFLENESDDRCPTPTMDEKPYEYISDPHFRTSNPVNNVINREQKHCHEFTENDNPNSDTSLHSDLESRTQRVLKCIDLFLSRSNLTETSQLETAGVNHSCVEIPKSSGKHIPTTFSLNHNSSDCKQISNPVSDVVSSCTTQELHTPSQHHVTTPFRSKIEEVLGVLLKTAESSFTRFERADEVQGVSVGQDCLSNASPSSECLQDFKETHKTLQPSLNQDMHSSRKQPVMAVKPSKDDESQGDQLCNDGHMENSLKSKQIKTPIVAYNTSTSREKAETIKGYSKLLHGHIHDSSYVLFKRLPNVSAAKSNSASPLFVDYQSNGTIEDSLALDPETSIVCTVYNTGHQRACSFLEVVSMRCLQNDLTQASMEQEHLIFSEKMKQLFKKPKGRTACDQEAHDKSKSFCSDPLIVQFSKLEELDDSLDSFDEPLCVDQKIMVDMPKRNDHTGTREGKTALHHQETGNRVDQTVTEECARLYEDMMNCVCAVKKIPPRLKFYRKDGVNQQTNPPNNFDFCHQMKRKIDESFYSNLNSVVKKSCKTKYRFYILATTADSFFEDTKVR